MPIKWTQKEIELLCLLWPNTPTEQVGSIIGRKGIYCWKKAKDLDLKRSAEFIKEQQEMFATTLRIHGVKSRFIKGQAAHNKGKKWVDFMPAESQIASRKTQFKLRNIPQNWKPIGWERVTRDGYIEVKVRDDYGEKRVKNFELKHRLLWEKINGPVPDGMMVKFKDGDKMNITIDNLFLASKKDNLIDNTMCDNSIVKRFLGIKNVNEIEFIKECAPVLIEVKRTQIKLNQKLGERCKKS
jgi:hypothetical protein